MDARSIVLTIFIIFELVAILLALGGNLIVAYVMIFKRKLAKSSHKLILSVSLADLLFGIILIPGDLLTVCCDKFSILFPLTG